MTDVKLKVLDQLKSELKELKDWKERAENGDTGELNEAESKYLIGLISKQIEDTESKIRQLN